MHVVIDAGQDGENLYPLTFQKPKCLIKILGKPLIIRILDQVMELNPKRITLLLKYKPNEMIQLFPEGTYQGFELSFYYADEDESVTKSIENVVADGDGMLVFVKGIYWFDFSLTELFSRFQSEDCDIAVVAVKTNDFEKFTRYKTDENSRVIEVFVPFDKNENQGDLSDCGICFLKNEAILSRSLATDFPLLIKELLLNEKQVLLLEPRGKWCGLTDIREYNGLCMELVNTLTEIVNKPKNGKYSIVPPVCFGSNIQIENGAIVGPNTVIGKNALISRNAIISNSVLSDDVYISSNCTLDGTVVGDGVSVRKGSVIQNGAVIGAQSIIGEFCEIGKNVVLNPKTNILSCEEISRQNRTYGNEIGWENYVVNRKVKLNCMNEKVKNHLLVNGFVSCENILKKHYDTKEIVSVKREKNSSVFKITAEAFSVEFAEELCDRTTEVLDNVSIDNYGV